MEKFRPEDSTDELSAFDAEKHGSPEYPKVHVTGYGLNGGVMVDVEGVGTYEVEIPAELDKHEKLTEGQVVVLDLINSRSVRVDVARLLEKDAKAVLLLKRDDKKSA